jgi:hypothetical protein
MKITKKLIVENSNIPPRLVAGVIRAIGGIAEFNSHYQDVANHGADSGFPGFIYYDDTVHFYKLYRNEILQLAKEMANDCGYSSLIEMIANFNCLKSYGFRQKAVRAALHRRTDDSQYINNALAWFALEEVCRDADYIREQAEAE